MMIGVTSAEAFILLNSVEMELGLETESRNKLVSDLVMMLIIGFNRVFTDNHHHYR